MSAIAGAHQQMGSTGRSSLHEKDVFFREAQCYLRGKLLVWEQEWAK